MTYEEYIIDEYNRAKVRYEALKLLKDGGVAPSPEPTPEPTPTPTPEPEPTGEDPEIVYNGPASYTIGRGENVKFSVYVNNVSSSRDYIINTSGEPTYYRCEEAGYKTNTGYRLDFNITGVNYGKGAIRVYLAADKTQRVDIAVTIR